MQSNISLLLTAKDRNAGATISDITKRIKKLEDGTKKAGKATDHAATSTDRLANSMRSAARGMAIMQGPLGPLAGRMSAVSASISGVGLAGTTATAGILGMAAAFAKAIPDGMEYEKTMRILKFATDDASDSFQFATDISHKYASSLRVGAIEFARLNAASRGSGIEAKKVRTLFEGITAASSTMGMSVDDTSGIFRAFSQIMSKGSLQAEEIRGQIGERLPGAFQLAAESMKMTTSEFSKAMEQGKITSVEFVNAVSDAMKTQFEGSALESVSSLQGQLNLLDTAWYELGVTLSKTGFTDVAAEGISVVTTAVEGLSGAITDLSNSGTLSQVSEATGKRLQFLVEAAKNIPSVAVAGLTQLSLILTGQFAEASRVGSDAMQGVSDSLDKLNGKVKESQQATGANTPFPFELPGANGFEDKNTSGSTVVTPPAVLDAKLQKELDKFQKHYRKLAEQAQLAGMDEIDAENQRFEFKLSHEADQLARLGELRKTATGSQLAEVISLTQMHNETIDAMTAAHDEKVIAMIQSRIDKEQLMRMDENAAYMALTGSKEEAELMALDAEFLRIDERFAKRHEQMVLNGATEAEIQAAIDQAKIVAAQKTAGKIQKSDEDTANSQLKVDKQASDARLSLASSALGTLAGIMAKGGKKAFEASKALAIAETIVSTYSAAQKSYESQLSIPTPDAPARAALAAGIAVVSGIAKVAAIASTTYGGSKSVSGGASGGSVPSSAPQSNAPTAPASPAPAQQISAINVTVQGGTVLDANFAADLADQLAGPMQQAFGKNRQYQVVV